MRMRGKHLTIVCALLYCGAVLGSPAPASAAAPQAKLIGDGRAVAPPSAPPAVKAMIEAANRIRHRPYVWGGGHRSWSSRGYDCSGSVSYVMHAAGLLDWPLDSTGFMRWGGGGAGSWVRIYANEGHVFAVIAGLRWDTSYSEDGDRSGPGWSEQMRPSGGFRLRHPPGVAAGDSSPVTASDFRHTRVWSISAAATAGTSLAAPGLYGGTKARYGSRY